VSWAEVFKINEHTSKLFEEYITNSLVLYASDTTILQTIRSNIDEGGRDSVKYLGYSGIINFSGSVKVFVHNFGSTDTENRTFLGVKKVYSDNAPYVNTISLPSQGEARDAYVTVNVTKGDRLYFYIYAGTNSQDRVTIENLDLRGFVSLGGSPITIE
jgi:hypothetical protein